MCACTSLSQDGFYPRDLWVGGHHWVWSDIPSLLTSMELFCACVVEKVSLTSRMRNIWSFISYLGRAQTLSPAILEYLFTWEELWLLSLGPVCPLLQCCEPLYPSSITSLHFARITALCRPLLAPPVVQYVPPRSWTVHSSAHTAWLIDSIPEAGHW